jgi:hypothetical protein
MSEITKMTEKEWHAEGERRFGKDYTNWKFECPVCKHVASGQDFKDAEVDPNSMYQECIGRHTGAERDALTETGEGPCNYAGYGLFRFSPVRVVREDGSEGHAFAFAEPEPAKSE